MRTPRIVLVAEDDISALYGILEILRDAGYECTGAATYDAARQLLSLRSYDLLVTGARLGPFNGLQLVQQCHHDYPGMAFVLVAATADAMVEIEARRYGAAVVAKPVRRARLLDAVAATMASLVHRRRWARKRVPAGVSVLVGDRPAALLDVSYGGVRFAMGEPGGHLPSVLRLEIPAIGSSVFVQPVWTAHEGETQTVECGAELMAARSSEARAWRDLVDRLPGTSAN
jgi:CheY-like chemotaxis protein